MSSWTPVRLRWESRDRHARYGRLAVVLLAVVGLVAGVVMAIFGLPPVDIHGPLHYVGIMDPLCGGTRGVRLALQGHLVRAWHYNPLSVALVGIAIAVVIRQAIGLVGGRWLNIYVVRRRLVRVAVAVLVVLLEINQQAHAALLRTTGTRFPFAGVIAIMAAGGVVAVVVAGARRHRKATTA